jgi:hypothetical protein
MQPVQFRVVKMYKVGLADCVQASYAFRVASNVMNTDSLSSLALSSPQTSPRSLISGPPLQPPRSGMSVTLPKNGSP